MQRGSSTRLPLPSSTVHGSPPTNVPAAACCETPRSVSPSVSNTPATLPSTPSTTNRGTLPRSTAPASSAGASVQVPVRITSGATAGRPAATCGHSSPTTICRPPTTRGRGPSMRATGPGSAPGWSGRIAGRHPPPPPIAQAAPQQVAITGQATRRARTGSVAIECTITR